MAKKNAPPTKFKIQTATRGGWADIKVSDGKSEKYHDFHFDKFKDAEAEMGEMKQGRRRRGEYRVVPAYVKSDFDLY